MSDSSGPWRPLEINVRFTAESLAELLDGGQAFRWNRQPDGVWRGQWANHVVELSLVGPTSLQWRPITPDTLTSAATLQRYLRLDDEQHDLHLDVLPWRSDAHLRKCITAFPGLRILRQPFGETLLGFLCSATKQIVQIKQMQALLAERHGSLTALNCHITRDKPAHPPLSPPPNTDPNCHITSENRIYSTGDKVFIMPTWRQIAELSEEQLRACQLGFRARYIKGTADYIKAHPGWLEQTAELPYAEARTALCVLPGVGEKIADCVSLFGLGHPQAFPVDTWMIKSMARRYGLDGWTPTQVAHFGRVHFGPSAGLAQQYLFAWERAHGGR
ncbi:MAG: DNA glycosylase [Opitutaceae bacterium]